MRLGRGCDRFRSWCKASAWVLFLPVMAGLWIWETGWPTLVRLLLVVGIAGWNLLVFLPRALMAQP